MSQQGDPWGQSRPPENDPYDQWFTPPTDPRSYPPPTASYPTVPAYVAPPTYPRTTVPAGRPPMARRSSGRHRLTALITAAAALAIAAIGGTFAAEQHQLPFTAGPLTGVQVAQAPASGGQSATPKKHVAPEPVYSVAEVAALVTPGVVVINSTLSDQNAIAAGTGMILTASGEILTNNHVIDGASSISVTVPNTGQRYFADLIGTSATNDVALLQLRDASGLATIPLAGADVVTTGTAVVAIGNAGGTGNLSVVSGTVTSTDRTITARDASGTSSERLSGMIEVKALIKAGDSGGPLANRAGRVIGMDTAASSANDNQTTDPTYGFAIPINRALAIAQAIRSGNPAAATPKTRGYLGIEVRGTDPAANVGGAVIVAVTPGSPAAKGGLVPGDTITDVDGYIVNSANSLTQILQQSKPGQQSRIGWVDKAGQVHHATITLASGPAD